jgi:hypothetical protein
MKQLSDWLRKISTGWVTLAGLVIFVLFTALVLPGQSSQADSSVEDVGSPDLSFTYSVGDLYKMAEAYGEVGRVAYIRARLTFDVVWPLVYGLFLVTSISWLFVRGFKKDGSLQLVNLAPVFGVLLDYLENLSTSLVMYRYPAKTMAVDFLAPIFTAVKWIFVSGSFAILLVGLVAWILSFFRKSRD